MKMTEIQRERALEAVRQMNSGGYVMLDRSGDHEVWRINGKDVLPIQSVEFLLGMGICEKAGDALFEQSDSQTLRLTGAEMPDDASFLKARFGKNWVIARAGTKAAVKAHAVGGRAIPRAEYAAAKTAIEFARRLSSL